MSQPIQHVNTGAGRIRLPVSSRFVGRQAEPLVVTGETEPIRLQELSAKSGIPLERLRQAAFGKVELSAEERALLPGWGRGEDG